MLTQTRKQIRLAYADQSVLVRHGIISFLKQSDYFEIDIQVNNGAELLNELKKQKNVPDICIMDINMPVKNGYDTIKEVKKIWPSMRILILTGVNSEYAIIQMLKNGANGYVLKTGFPEELRNALLTIFNVGNYHSELTTQHLHKAINTGYNIPQINDKEIQFLSYCCSDYHYKEIALKMGVSVRTIEGYRDDLFDKLNVKTRTGLAMYAISIGIINMH